MSETKSRERGLAPVFLMTGASLALCALIAAVHRASPRTLVARSLADAAVAQRFLTGQGADFPPENPFFAGEPAPTPWLVPWLGGKLAALLSIDALHGLELWALLAAAAFVLAACALGRRAYGNVTAGLVTAWLMLAGAFAQGPVVALYRWLAWGAPASPDDYLSGTLHPISRYMRIWDGWGRLGPLASELFEVGAGPIALGALVVALLGLHRVLEQPSLTRAIVLTLATAVCTGASFLVGGFFAVTLPVVALLMGLGFKRALVALACTLAGAALAWPTCAHAVRGMPLAWHAPHEAVVQVQRMAESVGLLLVLALIGVLRGPAAARRFGRACLLAALAALTGCAALLLPEGAEDALVHVALVLLAVPATGALVRTDGRATKAGFVVCAIFLAPFLVVVGARFGRAPIDVVFEGGHLALVGDTPLAEAYAWIRAESEPDAVFVLDPRPPLPRVAGDSAELPALTRRTILTERLEHPFVADHPDAQLRHWIAVDAVEGRSLAGEGDDYLMSLRRPVYIVGRVEGDAFARLSTCYGPPAFLAGDIAAFRWRRP